MIVFINGASSSGKTTLARALQSAWDGPLLHWSLDAVISQLPVEYTGNGEVAEAGFPLTVGSGGAEVRAGPVGEKLNELSAQYLRALSRGGFDVVADFVLLDERIFAPYRTALNDVPVLFVGLECASDVLEARNARRSDRAPGLSVHQQKQVHFCADQYDVRLDSTRQSTADLAAVVMAHTQEHSPGLGFSG